MFQVYAVPAMFFENWPSLEFNAMTPVTQYKPGTVLYSRKVFIGGVPINVDERKIFTCLLKFILV